MGLVSAPRPAKGWRSPLSLVSGASSRSSTSTSLKKQKSSSLLSAPRRSHKANQDHAKSRGDCSSSSRRSSAIDSWQGGIGPSGHSLLLHVMLREPMLLTPVLSEERPLSLILIRATPTVSTLVADFLCLSIPSSPLVQDFTRLMASTVLLPGQAAEHLGLFALHPNIPLPRTLEVRPGPGFAPKSSSALLYFVPLMLLWKLL